MGVFVWGGMRMALTESETFHATRRAVSRASKRYLRLVHSLPNNVLLACSLDFHSSRGTNRARS